jgi:hypothetical protein
MKRAVVVAAGVLVVIGVVLGVVLSRSSAGPPPLGNPATLGGGLDCTPGKTLANGFLVLENHSGQTVTVTSVRLTGGPGQAMTSRAYLVPAGPGTSSFVGVENWPPTVPQWKQRRLAVGGTIAPHTWANLVFAQTRTSSHPKPAAPEVTYTAGGSSYTFIDPVKVLVAPGNCPD